MTIIEALLIILIILVAAFILLWFFNGSSGKISFRRPVESRVDEYLDRRFEKMIEEWDLVQRPRLNRFKEAKSVLLEKDENQIHELQNNGPELTALLDELEGRLENLEKTFKDRK